MGWDFGWKKRADLVKEIVGERNGDSTPRTVKVFDEAVTGHSDGRLWRIVEFFDKGAGRKRRIIAVDLIDFEPGTGWGHKPMDESVGPSFYNCPVSWLDEVNEDWGKMAQDWRAKVRERAAQAA